MDIIAPMFQSEFQKNFRIFHSDNIKIFQNGLLLDCNLLLVITTISLLVSYKLYLLKLPFCENFHFIGMNFANN